MRTAIVDCDVCFRLAVVGALRSSRGLSLAGAFATGQSALKELPFVLPDVIIMDILLPGVDAWNAPGGCWTYLTIGSLSSPPHF